MTNELKPGQLYRFTTAQGARNSLVAGEVSDVASLKQGQSGQFPDLMEVQVIAEGANTGFSVTVEHTLDRDGVGGWTQVGAAIATGVPVQFAVCGGQYRVTAGTVTGGSVRVLAAVS
jgi:hypothetical protein